MLIFARDLLYARPVMASLMKAMFASSTSSQQNQYFDSKLTPRVQPHAHDPTLAWDKLKVKQIVKRLVFVLKVSYLNFYYVMSHLISAAPDYMQIQLCYGRIIQGRVHWSKTIECLYSRSI